MSKTQSEAIRLAYLFDSPLPPEWSDMVAAAATLRRLDAENKVNKNDIMSFHYAMKDAGWHPGRTDDLLTDIIRAKGKEMERLQAENKALRERLELSPWQTIETAPKDELILVARTKRMCGPCAAMNHSQDGWVTETPGEWVSIYTPTHWMPLPAAPGSESKEVVQAPQDALQSLLDMHAELLDANSYAYFELAYTRQTGWMVWITDRPFHGPVINPDRKVLARGQGGTPAEACAAAKEFT